MAEASLTQDRSTFIDRAIDEYRFGSPEDKLMTLIGLASIPLGAGATKGVVNAQKGLAGILKNYSPKVANESGYVRELGREIAEEIATNNAPEAKSSEMAQKHLLSEGMGLVDLGQGRYSEILPNGSIVNYQGLAGKDLEEARIDARKSPYPEESTFLNIMAKLGSLVTNGRKIPNNSSAFGREYIDSDGKRQVTLTGIGPRG